VTLCNSVEVHRSFGDTYCLHLQGRLATAKEAGYKPEFSASTLLGLLPASFSYLVPLILRP
jgi:hypothetical protein